MLFSNFNGFSIASFRGSWLSCYEAIRKLHLGVKIEWNFSLITRSRHIIPSHLFHTNGFSSRSDPCSHFVTSTMEFSHFERFFSACHRSPDRARILMSKLLCSVIMLLHWLQLFHSHHRLVVSRFVKKFKFYSFTTSATFIHTTHSCQRQNLMRWTRSRYISPMLMLKSIYYIFILSRSPCRLAVFHFFALNLAPVHTTWWVLGGRRQTEKWDH